MKKYLSMTKKEIILRLLFSIISAVFTAFLPVLLKLFADMITNGAFDLKNATIIIAGYIACLVGYAFSSYFYNLYQFKLFVNLQKYLKRDYFSSVISLNYTKFSKKDVGEYLSSQTNNLGALADYVDSVVDMISSILTVIIYTIVISVFINWIIAIVLISASVLSFFFSSIFDKKLSGKREEYVSFLGKFTTLIKSFFESKKNINSKTKQRVIEKHNSELDTAMKLQLGYFKEKSKSLVANGMTTYIPAIFGFVACIILFHFDMITIGIFIATFGYIESFVTPIEYILNNLSTIKSVKEIKQNVIKEMEYLSNDDDLIKLSGVQKIILKDVSVNYGEEECLKNINLVFEKGKKYAVIGSNGSGKSTLLRSVLGLVSPQKGKIMFDSHINSAVETSGIVWYEDQNDFIFPYSYEENVTMFGTFSLKHEKRINAILENIIETNIKINSNCQLLSGGEKQVVSFLRSLSSESEFLFLDEPFSAIDKAKRHKLINFLVRELPTQSMVFVTHDVGEQFELFDEIINVENGEISFKGNFKEYIEYENKHK